MTVSPVQCSGVMGIKWVPRVKELSNLKQEAQSKLRGIGEAQLMLITSMRFFFRCDHSDAFYLFWLLKKRKLWGYLYQCHMFDLLYKTVRGSLVMTPWYFNYRNPLSQTSLVVSGSAYMIPLQESQIRSLVGELTSSFLSGMVKIKREKKPTFSKHCSVLSLRMFLENDCLHVSNIVLFVRFSNLQKPGT